MTNKLLITYRNGSTNYIDYEYIGWINYSEAKTNLFPLDEICCMHIGGIEMNCKTPWWVQSKINHFLSKDELLFTFSGKYGTVIVINKWPKRSKKWLKFHKYFYDRKNYDYTIIKLDLNINRF